MGKHFILFNYFFGLTSKEMKYIWHFKTNFTPVSEHRGHICKPFGLIDTRVDSEHFYDKFIAKRERSRKR